jgi:hypothetical protein
MQRYSAQSHPAQAKKLYAGYACWVELVLCDAQIKQLLIRRERVYA